MLPTTPTPHDASRDDIVRRIENLRQLFVSYHKKERRERQASDEQDPATKPLTKKDDFLVKTEFEEVVAEKRPAISHTRKKSSLRWKNKSKTEKHDDKSVKRDVPEQRCDKRWGQEYEMPIRELIQQRDFHTAQKMMDEIRKSGMMESILNPVDNEVLRKLFETELMNPSSRDVRLLHEALNKLWEEVMCNLMKFSFEQESLVLLCEREKVKTRFLDVMLICPQNLPDCWGRRHMCATVEKSTIQQMLKSFHRDSVSVIPSPIAQSVTSQWTKHMKDIVDEKTKTQEAPMRKQLIEIDEGGVSKSSHKKKYEQKREEMPDRSPMSPSADVVIIEDEEVEVARKVHKKKKKKGKKPRPSVKDKKLEDAMVQPPVTDKRKDVAQTLEKIMVEDHQKVKKETLDEKEVKDRVKKETLDEKEVKESDAKKGVKGDYDNVDFSLDEFLINPEQEKKLAAEMKHSTKGPEGVIELLCSGMIENEEKYSSKQKSSKRDREKINVERTQDDESRTATPIKSSAFPKERERHEQKQDASKRHHADKSSHRSSRHRKEEIVDSDKERGGRAEETIKHPSDENEKEVEKKAKLQELAGRAASTLEVRAGKLKAAEQHRASIKEYEEYQRRKNLSEGDKLGITKKAEGKKEITSKETSEPSDDTRGERKKIKMLEEQMKKPEEKKHPGSMESLKSTRSKKGRKKSSDKRDKEKKLKDKEEGDSRETRQAINDKKDQDEPGKKTDEEAKKQEENKQSKEPLKSAEYERDLVGSENLEAAKNLKDKTAMIPKETLKPIEDKGQREEKAKVSKETEPSTKKEEEKKSSGSKELLKPAGSKRDHGKRDEQLETVKKLDDKKVTTPQETSKPIEDKRGQEEKGKAAEQPTKKEEEKKSSGSKELLKPAGSKRDHGKRDEQLETVKKLDDKKVTTPQETSKPIEDKRGQEEKGKAAEQPTKKEEEKKSSGSKELLKPAGSKRDHGKRDEQLETVKKLDDKKVTTPQETSKPIEDKRGQEEKGKAAEQPTKKEEEKKSSGSKELLKPAGSKRDHGKRDEQLETVKKLDDKKVTTPQETSKPIEDKRGQEEKGKAAEQPTKKEEEKKSSVSKELLVSIGSKRDTGKMSNELDTVKKPEDTKTVDSKKAPKLIVDKNEQQEKSKKEDEEMRKQAENKRLGLDELPKSTGGKKDQKAGSNKVEAVKRQEGDKDMLSKEPPRPIVDKKGVKESNESEGEKTKPTEEQERVDSNALPSSVIDNKGMKKKEEEDKEKEEAKKIDEHKELESKVPPKATVEIGTKERNDKEESKIMSASRKSSSKELPKPSDKKDLEKKDLKRKDSTKDYDQEKSVGTEALLKSADNLKHVEAKRSSKKEELKKMNTLETDNENLAKKFSNEKAEASTKEDKRVGLKDSLKPAEDRVKLENDASRKNEGTKGQGEKIKLGSKEIPKSAEDNKDLGNACKDRGSQKQGENRVEDHCGPSKADENIRHEDQKTGLSSEPAKMEESEKVPSKGNIESDLKEENKVEIEVKESADNLRDENKQNKKESCFEEGKVEAKLEKQKTHDNRGPFSKESKKKGAESKKHTPSKKSGHQANELVAVRRIPSVGSVDMTRKSTPTPKKKEKTLRTRKSDENKPLRK